MPSCFLVLCLMRFQRGGQNQNVQPKKTDSKQCGAVQPYTDARLATRRKNGFVELYFGASASFENRSRYCGFWCRNPDRRRRGPAHRTVINGGVLRP